MRLRYFLLGLATGIVLCMAVAALALYAVLSEPLPEAKAPSLPAGGDLTITAREGYLSKVAADMAEEGDLGVQGLVIDLQPANRVDLTVQTKVSILGLEMSLGLKVVTTVQAENGKLRITMQRLDLAGLGIPADRLPDSIKVRLEQALAKVNDEANRVLADRGYALLSVTTDEQTITVVASAGE